MRRTPGKKQFLILCGILSTAALLYASPALAREPVPVRFDPDVRLNDFPLSAEEVQREPSIARSAVDPKVLAALFIDQMPNISQQACSVASTSDGGNTWHLGVKAPLRGGDVGSCFDPSVASDAQGNFYFAYIDAGLAPGDIVTSATIDVATSLDGGRTFSSFSVAVTGGGDSYPDKPYMTVDSQPKSRFRGNVYVTYVEFEGSQETLRAVVSRDRGRSWSAPQTLSPIVNLEAGKVLMSPLPVVSPDGKVYIFYFEATVITGPSSIRFVSSSDGGRRWSKPADAAANLPTPVFFLVKNADPLFGRTPGAGSIGSGDPTAAIAPDGTIYLAWADFPQGQCVDIGGFEPACTNSDVRMSASRDGGKTWTHPVKVSDEANSTDQLYPWITTHPDGLVSLMWVDKRSDPENIDFDIFYTNTWDAVRFLPNVRASSATSVVGRRSYADYNGIAGTLDAVFPIWCDLRDPNNQEVYVSRGILLR